MTYGYIEVASGRREELANWVVLFHKEQIFIRIDNIICFDESWKAFVHPVVVPTSSQRALFLHFDNYRTVLPVLQSLLINDSASTTEFNQLVFHFLLNITLDHCNIIIDIIFHKFRGSVAFDDLLCECTNLSEGEASACAHTLIPTNAHKIMKVQEYAALALHLDAKMLGKSVRKRMHTLWIVLDFHRETTHMLCIIL